MSEPTRARGLPGLRGGDHVGITVPDLDQATSFLVDILGAERFFDLGPMESGTGWMSVHLGVPAGARVERLRFFRLGHGLNLEVFQYDAPAQRRDPPLNSDIGGHHIALYVDDFDTALAYLHESGVDVMGEPTVRTSGPNAGQTWIYFRAPWGLQFELLSYPRGKAYERDTDRRLWDPRTPGD
jgi:catechol 2,3-dioxygenase-like lactoylglutathione lyase family enzyme